MAISLQVRYSRQEDILKVQAHLLKVEVLNAVDMSSKVFVFQRNVTSATDAEANQLTDAFVSIADPVDLEEYPEDTPDITNEMPYYRLDSVTMKFRSLTELEETKELIETDLQELVDSLKAEENVVVMEEATYA